MKNGHNSFSAVEYSKELRAVGFTQEQAELQARQWELIRNERDASLATKNDMELIKKDIKGLDLRIAKIEKETADIRKETADIRKETADIRKETADIRKDTKDQTLKVIGVLGGLMAILKFLPDFFN